MGMDVYGTKPKNEKGEYFRNNVWWWRPLWNFCLDNYPELAGKVEDGHSNSGFGLNATDSKKLATLIKKDLESGKVHEYRIKREAYINSLPLENCEHCSGTGIRNDEYVKGTCNACSGLGKRKAWATEYPFDVDNVIQFQEFLDNCGGFSIH
jgi:DnaJ-class molecular chaperone